MTAAKAKTNSAISTKPLSVGSRMLALEPRYVFDAAIATELQDIVQSDVTVDAASHVEANGGADIVAAAHELAGTNGVETTDSALEARVAAHNLAPFNQEIAFVDSRLADIDSLIGAIPEGTRIVLIDGARDGVVQMVDALAGEQGITGIHILSHGSEGRIELGASTIDESTMSSVYRAALSSIRANMAESADILVYGCNFGGGEIGGRAAQIMAELTGADVAASEDLTGAATLGGDWDLEVADGEVDRTVIRATGWHSAMSSGVPFVDLNPTDNVVPPVATGNSSAGQLGPNSPDGGFTATGSNATGTFNVSTVTGTGFDEGVTILADANGVRVSLLDADGNSDGSGGAADTLTVQIDVAADNNSRLDGIVLSHGAAGAQAENAKDMTLTWVGGNATIFDPDGQLVIVGAGGATTPANGQTIASGAVVRTVGASVDATATTWSIFVPTGSLRVDAIAVNRPDGAGTSNDLLGESLTFNAVLSELGHTGTYLEGGAAVAIASPHVVISDDGQITRAQANLIVASTGDRLIVDIAALPAGITVDPASTTSSIILVGAASPADYATALAAIKFETVGDKPDVETVRNVEVQVTDDAANTSKIANALISVQPDNDHDGVIDSTDIDDDNDGILDAVENIPITLNLAPVPSKSTTSMIVLEDPTGSYRIEITKGDNPHLVTFDPATGKISDNGFQYISTEVVSLVYSTANSPIPFKLDIVQFNDIDSMSTTSVRDSYAASVAGTWEPVGTPAAAVVSVDAGDTSNTDGDGLAIGNIVRDDADWTSANGTVPSRVKTFQALLDADNGATGDGDGVVSDVLVNFGGSSDNHVARLLLDDPQTEFSLYIFDSGQTGMAWNFTPTTTITIPPDSDGDTIPDGHDIDSDNDGILDNIEAQRSVGYIAPSGPVGGGFTDVNGDGLDDRYDDSQAAAAPGFVGKGLTPVDTDSDGTGDWRDRNSDNDALDDVAEAGHSSTTGSTDTDFDGLLDVFEGPSANDGFIVNDGISNPLSSRLPDADGDAAGNAPMTADLDYRDARLDNGPPSLVDPDPAPGTPYVDPTNPAKLVVPAVDNVAVAVDLDSYYTDPNGDPLTITPNLAGLPSWVTYDPVTHVLGGTPPADNAGPVDVPVTVTDGNGGTFVGIVSIQPANPGPDAVNDTQSVPATGASVLTLTANDTDPDNDPLTVTSATLADPSKGSLTLNGDGTWSFTPAAGVSGPVAINYTIQDRDGATDTAQHTVTVANQPPSLVDPDPAPGTPYVDPTNPAKLVVPAVDNVAVAVDLDSYYTDPNGDPLTITPNLAGLPSWVTYDPVTHVLGGTPPADNAGPVDVPVTVTDGNGGTFVGIVSIQPANPGPTAVAGTTHTGYLIPIAVPFTANDRDPDGDPLTVKGTPALVNPAHGTLSKDPTTGTWTFTPAAGFSGTAVINYTIQDQDGATSSSTHSIVVANAPPKLVDPDPTPGSPSIDPAKPTNLLVPAIDKVPVSLDLDSYYTDANGNPLTFTPNMTGVPSWLTYNPTTHVLSGTPPADNTGRPVVVPVTVSDGKGGSIATTITITPVNPGPTAVAGTTHTGYLVPIAVPFTANDRDPDGDPLTVKGTPALVNPAHGSLSKNPTTGVWTFTPAAGFSGTAVINYTIQDQDGATSSSTHSIVVANAPPKLVDPDPTPGTPSIDPAKPTNLLVPAVDNVAVAVDLDSYYTDANGNPLTFTPNMTGVPSWLTYNPTTHVLSGTPPADNTGRPVVVPVTVSDGKGGSIATTITITPVNPGPTAVADSTSTNFGKAVIVPLLANDTDPDGDLLTVKGTPTLVNPAHGSLIKNPTTGAWTFKPATGFYGTAVINYTVQDRDGATSSSTHSVTVVPPPRPIAVDDTFTGLYGKPVAGNAALGDTFPAGSTFAVATLPSHGTVTMQPNGTYTYVPAAGFAGTDTFTYRVTNAIGQSVVATDTIIIRPPAIAAVNDSYSTAYNTQVRGNAAAGDTFVAGSVFSVVSLPAKGTVTMAADGKFTYTPPAGFAGTVTFNYQVKDPTGQVRTAVETIVVRPPALVAVDDSYSTAYATPVNGNAAAGDTFAPGSTFKATSSPAHGTVAMRPNGTYVYTPAIGFSGTDTFTYSITDPVGNIVTATETITVAGRPLEHLCLTSFGDLSALIRG